MFRYKDSNPLDLHSHLIYKFQCGNCNFIYYGKTERYLNSLMMEIHIILNKSTDLQSKSMDWFLYDRDLRHEESFVMNELKLDNNKINNNKTSATKDHCSFPRDFEILGWCPAGTFLPHGEKVPL